MPDLEKIEMPHAFGLGPPPSEDEVTWRGKDTKYVGKMQEQHESHMKPYETTDQDESCSATSQHTFLLWEWINVVYYLVSS